MMTPEEEAYALENAYVPEHIVPLMSGISKGDPSLKDDHLMYAKDNWLILVGYPLDGKFSQGRCESVLEQAVKRFQPEYLWFIGPEIPASLSASCQERQTDQYYKLDLEQANPKASLLRAAERALQELTVVRGRTISKEHEALIAELMKRERLPVRIKELYRAMPHYVTGSQTACILEARRGNGKLSAFFVVELGAKHFSTYVLGTHSKKHYVPHASDLLFLKMIELTRECGKSTIHLGLGVNEGIRRFKEKWGGIPFLKYEFCERCYGYTRTVSLIKTLEGKL